MKKTIKYFIEFEAYETSMSTKLEISKNNFNKQLSFLRKQVEESKNNEIITEEAETKKYDYETTIETLYVFYTGCATTYLSKLECKDGYYFKRKQ